MIRSGVPVKAMNEALGSAVRMLSARVSYWQRWAFSVMTMMSLTASIVLDWMLLIPFGAELLNQGEDVAVVLGQGLAQMTARCRLRLLLGHRTGRREVL